MIFLSSRHLPVADNGLYYRDIQYTGILYSKQDVMLKKSNEKGTNKIMEIT